MNSIKDFQDLLGSPANYVDVDARVIPTKVDVLALSCALYRKHNADGMRFSADFDSCGVEIVEDQDREMADTVAQHFGSQITMSALTGEITRWQSAVDTFLRGDRLSYTRRTQGMIHRLPEFYDFDVKFQSMVDTEFSERLNVKDFWTQGDLTLRPVNCMVKILSSKKMRQYWFKDTTSGIPVKVEIRTDNQLGYLWDHMFATRETIKIGGRFKGSRHPSGFEYVTSDKWFMRDI